MHYFQVESQITMINNIFCIQAASSPPRKIELYWKQLKMYFMKIPTFCSWLSGKFIVWIKKVSK